MKDSLTDKQRRFCQEYIVDLNATKAAIRAGYVANCARWTGCTNLTKPNIKHEIARLQAGIAERLEIQADDVVRELIKLAFSNIKNYLAIEGDEVYFKDFSELTDAQAAAVESVKVTKKTIKGKNNDDDDVEVSAIQFKLHSKTNTLEQLGKHLGIYERDNLQRGSMTIMDIMALIGIGHNVQGQDKTEGGREAGDPSLQG
jgi:phage terminase small subunit